jgi:hypothetical protein
MNDVVKEGFINASYCKSWWFSMTPGANLTLNLGLKLDPEDDIKAPQISECRKAVELDAVASSHSSVIWSLSSSSRFCSSAPPHTFALPHGLLTSSGNMARNMAKALTDRLPSIY